MADVRRFDPGQGRDPDGKWGDGMPGPDLPDLDTSRFTVTADIDGTFGQLVMGYDHVGDVVFAFHEHTGATIHAREMELGSDELADLADALESLADQRDEAAASDTPPGHVFDAVHFGNDDKHIAELMPNGMIVIVFGVDDDDPWSLSLDPPNEDGGDDDVASVVEGIDATLAEASRVGDSSISGERKFDPAQKRDPNGEWGDGASGASALKDTLKLDGKIDLAPDEKLFGSAKVDGDQAGIRMALTEQDGKRMLRLGVGGEGYGQRNPELGTQAWDGNPSREPLSMGEQDRLTGERKALDTEYDTASPTRRAEIDARLDEIHALLFDAGEGFNGTAKLDEYGMRRLADRIGPALAEAVAEAKREAKAWDEIDALEAKGNPDPARMAELRRIARADETDTLTFDEGIVPGSDWGDVHFSVELDEVDPYVHLGVFPKGAPDDWGDGRDWTGQFDAAETRKILRLLDRFASTSASRNRDPKEAPVFSRAFQPEAHPRAPAGSDTGGEFAKGGGGQQKKPTPKRPTRRPTHGASNGTMAYDPNSNNGTGYDSKEGDPRVHELQQALARLGIKDSQGKPLKDDGKLGPKTTSAVKELQQQLGLKPDGKVTPALLQRIKSMKSLPAKRSAFMDVCVRAFDFEFESRSRSGDGRTLEGYAAVFNSPTRIAAVGGDFDEVISPGAFARSIRSRMPVLQFEHGRDPRVGAVPIGAIEDLSEDSQGLHVRATLFDNPVVEPVRQAIAGQAIKGMSFRFQVVDGGDQWQRRSGAIDLRTVGDADVHELGPVVFPAYDTTTVSVRSLLAQLGPEEHRTLLRELAYDLRSLDLDDTARQPTARSSGSGDTDTDDGSDEQHLSIRQRLDQGALRTRGIIK